MNTEASRPLHGQRVLVTRPAHQNDHLCQLIEQAGGEAVSMPVLTIEAVADRDGARQKLLALASYDIAVFISRNAVEQTFELLGSEPLPRGVDLATVGGSTSEALESRGYSSLMPEKDYSSEGLLALPELEYVDGLRIAIIRGEGGREVLAGTLRRRGAEVDYIEVYRRSCPEVSARRLQQVFLPQAPDLITATSTLVLQNLLSLATERFLSALLSRPLVVLGERTREYALQQGFGLVLAAERSDDEGILAALIQIQQQLRDDKPRRHG